MKFVVDTNIAFSAVLNTENLVRDVDMNDIAFVTLAEFLGVKIWTGDRELIKGLAKKGFSNFITTDELSKLRILLEE